MFIDPVFLILASFEVPAVLMVTYQNTFDSFPLNNKPFSDGMFWDGCSEKIR